MKLLEGKVAVVTGAARGIGKAIALKFAQEGANIAFTDLVIDENGLATQAEIEALGVKAKGYASNAANFEETHNVVAEIVKDFGRIDILVNNALNHYSFDPRNRSTFDNTGWNDYATQLEGCLKGTYNTCTATLPYMRRQSWGRIVNISSNLVDSPIVPYHDYIAAKGALIGLTRSLAQEAGAWGVTVNAIAAGLTVGTDSSRATTEDVRERIIAQTPLGRLATADDIAGGVAMLVGEDARFVTGQTLHVDGGLTMR